MDTPSSNQETNRMLTSPEIDLSNPDTTPALWRRLLPYVGMLILAITLWLPFGFKTTGLYEELLVTKYMDAGSKLYFIVPGGTMDSHRARPLEVFFHQLAYTLDNNSYLYYNVLAMLFFFGKMVVVYWLVLEFLPRHKLLAFFTGLLFVIYPSDSGLFTFRAFHIHGSTLAFLLALYLFIQFWRREGRKSQLALAGASALLLFSLLQYQIALPMAVVSPLILLYFKRPSRRFFLGIGVWYAIIAIAALYAFWASQQSSIQSYEASRLADSAQSTTPLLQGMLDALLLAYQRQVTTWAVTLSKLDYLTLYAPYVLFGVLIAVMVGIWLLNQQRRDTSTSPSLPNIWRYLLLIVAGIAFFAIGIAIYMPFPVYRNEDFRIFFLGMLGSTLVLTLLLYGLSQLARRYSEIVFLILVLPFWGLALLGAFAQHQYYANYSLIQQNAFQQIAQQAPQFKPDTELVVIDPLAEFNGMYTFFNGYYLQHVLDYLYHDPSLKVLYCAPNDLALTTFRCHYNLPILSDDVIPQFPDDKLSHQLVFMVTAEHQLHLMTADEINQKFNTTAYNPKALLTGDQPPLRAKTMLSCDIPMSCYRQTPDQPTDTFTLPDTGEIGSGWTESSPYEDGFIRWSIYPRTTVNLNLTDNKDLALEFKMKLWLNDEAVTHMKLNINGQDIPFTFEPLQPSGRIYRAVIPRSALAGQPSHTQLVFSIDSLSRAPGAPDYYLGWTLSGLTIKPAAPLS